MRLFKIEFIFDTGVTYENRVCIIRANDRPDAVQRFIEWITPQLGGDEWVKANSIKAKEIKPETMVIYTDFHSYYRKH